MVWMDPYSSQNLQKYIQHELCADDQLTKSRCLDVLFAIYTSYWKVLRLNIDKVLSRKMTIFSMPRPLFDGIMFLTACDVDFILKCEWIHISGGSMWNVYLSKTKVHHEMTHSIYNMCRTLSCVHRKKNCLNS
jgi:hypothetical protein